MRCWVCHTSEINRRWDPRKENDERSSNHGTSLKTFAMSARQGRGEPESLTPVRNTTFDIDMEFEEDPRTSRADPLSSFDDLA